MACGGFWFAAGLIWLWWWVFDSLCTVVVVSGYFGGFCGFVVGWWLLLVCGLVYRVGGGCLGVMLA